MTLFEQPVPTWSVSALLGTVDALVEQVFPSEVWVEGEMRNRTRSRANHVYFDLVDAGSPDSPNRPSLSVTLFDSDRQNVNRFLTEAGGAVRMTDGTLLRIRGRVGVYAPKSTIQLVMTGIDPSFTLGVLGLERERLLARLREEELLDANATLTVPRLPLQVGLVTSRGTAAYADALHEFEASGYGFRVSVFDCWTQGAGVPHSVAAALSAAGDAGVDVVALVRGGGARTDLAGFDHEVVARAIAGLDVPVWTGIGHETDRSVADEVAHTPHKTPTACAAAVVARVAAAERSVDASWTRISAGAATAVDRVGQRLRSLGHRSSVASVRRTDREALHVHHLSRRLVGSGPRALAPATTGIDDLVRRLATASTGEVRRGRHRVDALAGRAQVHDLIAALDRGWSITRRADGSVVRDPDEVSDGDIVVTLTSGGTFESSVLRPDEEHSPMGTDR